ncbi:MAG: porin family protein [Bacteroidaceae bacterium]|nr:porin family protein [Bacteroidaceae bacterium]
MKKIYFILSFILCIGIIVPAQAQLKFGVRGGTYLAKAKFTAKDLKTSNYTGYFFGPMLEFTVPIIGIGVDGSFLYSQRGVTVEGYDVEQKGFDVPVNLKYTIGLGSMAGIYLAAGPDFFFAFDDDSKTTDSKKSQVSLNLGAGLKLLKHWQIGANYNLPMSNTAKYINESGKQQSYKTEGWQLSLAYTF